MALTTNNTELNDFLKIMDVADAINRQNKEVDNQLSYDERKTDIIKRLKATYDTMGKKVSDEELAQSVDVYFSKQFEFKAPAQNLFNSIAVAYVNRNAIWRKKVLPALWGLGIIGAVTVGYKGFSHIAEKAKEQNVEDKIEQLYTNKKSLSNILVAQEKSPVIKSMPAYEKETLNTNIQVAREQLNTTETFFKKYAPQGSSDNAITSSNYKSVGDQIPAIEKIIGDATTKTTQAKGVITNAESLIEVRSSLDNIIAAINKKEATTSLKQKAGTIYKDALMSVENRQLAQSQSYVKQLNSINNDINTFNQETRNLEKEYSAITTVAKEKLAKEQALELYTAGKQYIYAGDVSGLQRVTSKLTGIENQLNLEYTVFIRGGDDRDWTNDRGERATYYYVFVEALDPNGNTVEKSIRDVETDQTEKVSKWAEQVPEGVYFTVKEDKKSDGVLDNEIFAIKEKGYLNEIIKYTDNGRAIQRGVQMYKWRRNE